MPSHYRNSYENYYNAGNRPIPAGNPYGYSYFNPTGKEQAALTIGSLLAGALAASSGRSTGDAIRKGLAGAITGYGSGYQNYQNLMSDAFGRDLQAKSYGQRVKEYEEKMGLDREKFAEEKRQYEETEKPYKQATTNWYNQRESTPIDYNKIRDERTLRRLNIRQKQKELSTEKPVKMPDVGNYGKLKAQLAALQSTGNMDYIGMPAEERTKAIADLKNTLRVMEKYQPDLIPPQQQTQQIPQQGDAMSRHQSDPAMQGTELGKLTPQGYEVYKNGKLVGHYQ